MRQETRRPRYHQTEIKTFLKCGRMWEFRYVRGIRIPPSAACTVGSSVDTAVSENLRQKMTSRSDLPTEEVLDHYSTDFERRRGETDWTGEHPGKQKDVGAALVKLHHQEVAPRILPASVQESFVIETDAGYDLGGTLDLTETSGVIADTKTSRTAYAPDAVQRALQPALYDYAYEALHKKSARKFRFDVLIKPTATRGPCLQQVEAKVSRSDRVWLFETIHQVHRAIQAGVALPAPEGSWYCSAKWCGYWSQCKGSQKGRHIKHEQQNV